MRNASGEDFNPILNTDLRDWLLRAEATNMAYMLSAQLAATKLNVLAGEGFPDGSTIVYIDPDTYWSSSFISIES